MKNKFILISLVVTVIALAGCSGGGGAVEGPKAKTPESAVSKSTNGEVIITLDEATQTRMGLKTETLAAIQLAPEIKGFGRVVDPAAIATVVADLISADVTFTASGAEFERLKVLTKQGNASARALQTAEAAARRDELLAQTARTKLTSSWGKAVAGQKDLASFAMSLASLEAVLVRIDLPAGQTLETLPASVRIVGLSDEKNLGEAEFFGAVPGVDPQTQSRGFLFLAKQNPLLVPNAAVTGCIKVGGEPLNGVVIPRGAILRHDGQVWIYAQIEKDEFIRREILLARAHESGWFVTSGAKPGDKVIIVGAQQLLSEELKGQGSE